MLVHRPTTLAECDEQIVRVDACLCEAAREHERAVECSCHDQLDELYAIRAALIPPQRPPSASIARAGRP